MYVFIGTVSKAKKEFFPFLITFLYKYSNFCFRNRERGVGSSKFMKDEICIINL